MGRQDQRFRDTCFMELGRWGGPSVMLWGVISWGRRISPTVFKKHSAGRGRCVTARRNIDEVMQPIFSHSLTYDTPTSCAVSNVAGTS